MCSTVVSSFSAWALPQVVLTAIYTFPIGIMLTKFAIQHITSHTEVAGKLLASAHLETTNQDHPNDVDLRCSPGVHGGKKPSALGPFSAPACAVYTLCGEPSQVWQEKSGGKNGNISSKTKHIPIKIICVLFVL